MNFSKLLRYMIIFLMLLLIGDGIREYQSVSVPGVIISKFSYPDITFKGYYTKTTSYNICVEPDDNVLYKCYKTPVLPSDYIRYKNGDKVSYEVHKCDVMRNYPFRHGSIWIFSFIIFVVFIKFVVDIV